MDAKKAFVKCNKAFSMQYNDSLVDAYIKDIVEKDVLQVASNEATGVPFVVPDLQNFNERLTVSLSVGEVGRYSRKKDGSGNISFKHQCAV